MNNPSEESGLSYYGWIVVGMAFLGNLITFGLVYSFSVFFKPLAYEFGWSRAIIAGAFSAYAITHDIFAPFCGWLTDRFGPRVSVFTGGMCLAGSMILMSGITTLWELYLYYAFLFGWGVAAIYAPMMATVSRWFYLKRGLAIGIASTGAGTGSFILSPLAAWLISLYGWRTAYTVVGIMAFAIFIPIVIFIKQAPRESLEPENQKQWSGNFSFAEVLKTKVLWLFSFSLLFIALALWTIMLHIVPLLTDNGLPLTIAGLLAGLAGGASIIGRISAGFLSDKLGRKPILLNAYCLQLAMLVWLLFSNELWMFVVFALLFGISFGGWTGVLGAFPADYFGLKATGTIFGFIVIMAGIGGAIGSFMGGYLFDITRSYYYTVAICILATLVAIVLASIMEPPEKA